MARRALPTETMVDIYSLFTVSTFEPGINTADPKTELAPDESPDCIGVSMEADGRLVKSVTAPTGTARIQRGATLSGVPYKWEYNRLWNFNGLSTGSTVTSNLLRYGAMFYDDIYQLQRNGLIPETEDSSAIVAIVPFGQDNLFVAKTTGSYVVGNCLDTRAFFQQGPILQEMACPAANQIVELDGVIYVSNAGGVYAYQGGQTKEITRKVRDAVTAYANVALTADYSKKRIIGGTSVVYDVATEKWVQV